MRRRIGPVLAAAGMLAGTLWAAPPLRAQAATSETLVIDARNPNPVSTNMSLQAGVSYTVVARGTFAYLTQGLFGIPVQGALADAECTNLPPDTTFQRNRFALFEPDGDLVDLYVNGQNVEWTPLVPDAFGCDSTTHTYTHTFTPAASGPVSFVVHERDSGGYNDNQGTLTVVVGPTESLVDSFALPSNSAFGATSNVALTAGRSYRIEVAGTYDPGAGGITADAECASVGGGPGQRHLLGFGFSSTDPNDDLLDVYVNGEPVDWVPRTPSVFGCDDTTHAYTFDLVPEATGPVRLHVHDTYNGDNTGVLQVQIFELVAPPPPPSGIDVPTIELSETVNVDSANPDGANSLLPVRAGETVLLEAGGTYAYGAGTADAECANAFGDPTFVRHRYSALPDGNLDVLVNNQAVEWAPTRPTPQGCNEDDHTYRVAFTPAVTGPLNLRVADTFYGDNGGVLTVKIFVFGQVPTAGTLIDTFDIPAASPAGATSSVTLQPGNAYRIEVQGQYSTGFPGLTADAECSQLLGTPGQRRSPFAVLTGNPSVDLLDVYVNNRDVEWVPARGAPMGCDDTDHRYTFDLRPTAAGPVNLRVIDTNYLDNAGVFQARIFLVSAVGQPPGALPRVALSEEVTVPAADPSGASTVQPLVAGRTYLIEASGIYGYGVGLADAECTNTILDPNWLPDRFAAIAPPPEDLQDLLVDNTAVDWQATQPNPDGCNVDDHRYRIMLVPAETRPVNFRVSDRNYFDNSGTLTVKVFVVQEVPLGTVTVDATNPSGAFSPPLVAGQRYRFHAAGTYSPWTAAGWVADAECSDAGTGVFLPGRFRVGADDFHDLYVDNHDVTWVPASGSGACDPGHEYDLDFVPSSSGPVNLRIADTGYADNSGSLAVSVFQVIDG